MENWLEPALAPPKPSFAEAGIERHGVVANMAALGTLPSAKVLKAAARSDSVGPLGREGVVKKSGASSVSATPSEPIATPEPTAVTPRLPSAPPAVGEVAKEPTPPPPATAVAPTPPPPTPTSVSAPHTPIQATTHTIPRQLSLSGGAYGQSVFALQRPIPASMPRPVPQPVIPPPMMNANGEFDINLAITDRVVESAVAQALDERRWPTAYALRTIYDDHRLNPRMVRLIDAIYNGRADENERKQFNAVMSHKKKEGKKDRTGEYYFNGDGSDPLPPKAPQFSASMAYSMPSGRSATGAGSVSDAQARRASFNQSSMSASPYKESDPSIHGNKRHKTNNFQAPSDLEMNGSGNASAANGTMKPQQPPAQQNGTPNVTRPTRNRSRSISSSSSLSSLDEADIGSGNFSNTVSPLHKTKESSHHAASSAGGAHTHSTQGSPRFAHANNANTTSAATETYPSLRNQSQPITTQHKPGPKTFTFSTVNPSPASAALSSTNNPANNTTAKSSSSHRRHSSSTNSSMAPAALLPSSKNSSSSALTLPQQVVFKTKKDPSKALARQVPDDEVDVRGKLKRKAREKALELQGPTVESFVRHQVPPPDSESASDGGESVAVGPSRKRPSVRLVTKKQTRQSQAALNYDSDTLSSPTLLSFQPDLAPGSLSVSRAGTPNNLNRPTRKGPKTGSGLRVKTSPMKKKGGGTLAGIPRASGERNSPTGNGAFSNSQDDNDDYCSSCGGNGDLVCCDGCTRSFHFKCVDPPINEGSLPDEWFCNVCLTKGISLPRRDGSFGALLTNLERKNPSAFHLPKDIREYFEGVKTGTEGEYEEAVPPKPKERQRAGYDEQPDYFKLKDAKGKTILCHICHRVASSPDRAIIPCTFCGLYWHLDCLDVPMAKEPAPGKPWRCPAHVDDLLTTIPSALAPAHRFRKIKGASVIRPAVTRGVRNNGHIEIENDPTDDEEELGFYEQREYGHIYKLPELGIKLDFISQVRQKTGGGYAIPPPRRSRPQISREPPPSNGIWDQRTLSDQQAALNLASLAIPVPETGDPRVLIDALLANAPPTVVAMIAQGDLIDGSKEKREVDKLSLLALKALIEQRLSAFDEEPVVEKTNGVATETEPVIEGERGDAEVDEKVETGVEADGDKDIEMSG